MKLEIAPTFHYETVLRPALDPPLLLQQRPALRPPPLRYLSPSAAAAHRACRQVTVGLPLRRQLEPPRSLLVERARATRRSQLNRLPTTWCALARECAYGRLLLLLLLTSIAIAAVDSRS